MKTRDVGLQIHNFIKVMSLSYRFHEGHFNRFENQANLRIANSEFSDKSESIKWAVRMLLLEDCGLLALAVGLTLELRGVSVRYHTNGYHYFISVSCVSKEQPTVGIPISGVRYSSTTVYYFDALHPYGTTNINDMVKFTEPAKVLDLSDEGDAQWLHERLDVDVYYREAIEAFVGLSRTGYKYPY